MENSNWKDIYKEIGATPVINAIGSVTMLGGSITIPEVNEAMERANSTYIPMADLQEKVGRLLSEIIDVPAAYVTSGAGSALTLATAAIMVGTDDTKIQQLPDTTGMKNEILIQQRQRYWYDRCLEMAGAKLVQFGSNDITSKSDLESAIGPSTAAVHYHMVESKPDPNALSLQDTIDIAHSHNIPVTVDAAGEIYPIENIGKYVRMGADFQCIAAKYLGASQSTGLALGTKEMIEKISCQSFIGYESRRIRGIGRPHKVDRQEMIGVVAAIKHWFTIDHEDRLARVEQQCQNIATPLNDIDGLQIRMMDNIIGHQPFGIILSVDPERSKLTAQGLVDALKAGDPPIWTRVGPDQDTITIHGFGLQEGEDRIVGERINQALTK